VLLEEEFKLLLVNQMIIIIMLVGLVKRHTAEKQHKQRNSEIEDINFLGIKGRTSVMFDVPNLCCHVGICTYHLVQMLINPMGMAKVNQT